ncbi:hypothetical protein ASPWEDRAFT_38424 [Aspergillus wentii DTO 134E9]|uniref:Protein PXR1 n=1 Tax=Aspergillus wentii DTO 134E9 TaxID=1073089 RepID=A0A1L9RPP5_ASPWE|nr:uncharacterized protein ASPWEDRAFT_38424 [Aspergillus wentii DTO 134E9]KAI9924164.1 telomerase inhibitor [Aspergillus wentii]OJJ36787.1 hypothetical protein ASPWEDRAFT_38424 [Aspergillus wentii DTO 134E9]
MGLAAPRKRTKISHDPNNTNWSRSTSGFGHKILSSQGWKPGNFLGARNAAHADMFTAASASHIKVVLKDDTLGLGARPKRDPLGEPTGLDAFKGLLGRLNGKSDTVLEEEQRKRDDVKLARYAATKWQEVRFISGGLLVQEKIDALSPKVPQEGSQTFAKSDNGSNEKGHKKTSDTQDDTANKSSKKKTSRNKRSNESSEPEGKQDKKAKKRKHIEERGNPDSEIQQGDDSKSVETPGSASSSKASAVSKERRPMGRHMFRGRHIAQKKKALLDDKSLNEIFMVKSVFSGQCF